MKIAVCMKYVPLDLTSSIDERSGGILRSAENSTINQADRFALEAALRLKARYKGSVSVYSMGPKFAVNLLREACALGADELFLISDKLLAGSDSYVTALVLAAALGNPYDLILCGERTVDGETGQVPGELSARLKLPFATGVTEILEFSPDAIECICLTDTKRKRLSVPLPAVLGISCGMGVSVQRMAPSLKRLRLARDAQPTLIDTRALGLPADQVGMAGSPSTVVRTFAPDWTRTCTVASDLTQGIKLSLEVVLPE